MHTIHHTEAFVLDSEEQGEANATVIFFTRELGLVSARAQGLKKPLAKLRSHLVPYALVSADFVRGRGFWRVISARTIANKVQSGKRASAQHARAFVRLLGLVERLVPSESLPDEELFDHLVASFALLHETSLPKKYVDTLMLWKAVSILGYGASNLRSEILFTLPLADAIRDMTDADNADLIKVVTDALHHSHL
jgi:recombinational DNA repair protein (RecF pathway)